MSERMKKHLMASWLIYTTTGDGGDGGDAGGGDSGGDNGDQGGDNGGDGQGSSGDGGDGSGDNGDGKTPLALDQIPEEMRSLFDGIETQEDLAARLKGPEIPEAYTLPTDLGEGVTFDEAAFGEFQPIAKELGLSQEAVNTLIKFQAKLTEGQAASIYDRVLDLQAEGFKTELGKIQESMGEKFAPAHAQAMKTIEAVASPEIMAELNSTGLINSPLVFKLGQEIYQKLMKEDSSLPAAMPVKEGIVAGDPATAKNFYAGMTKGKSSQAEHGKP